MARLLLWAVGLMLILGVTLAALRFLGSRGELALDSYHLDGCWEKHCSKQIELGKTTWQQATSLFNSDGGFNCWIAEAWWEDCIFSDNYSRVGIFSLGLKESRVRVGDVINKLGDPLAVHRCREDLSTSLIFKGNVLVELAAISREQFDPATAVGRIEYYSHDIPDLWARSYWQSWHGFASRTVCSY